LPPPPGWERTPDEKHKHRFMDLDLHEKHAADVDDIQFSIAAAAIFVGSYTASPRQSDHYYAEDSGVPRHSFALLFAIGCIGVVFPCATLVHWIVSKFRQRQPSAAAS
jgi:hypothetical protein